MTGKTIKAFIPDVDWLGDYGIEEVLDRINSDFSCGMFLFEDGTAVFAQEIEPLTKTDINRQLKEFHDFIDSYADRLEKVVTLRDMAASTRPAKATKPVTKVAKKAPRPRA